MSDPQTIKLQSSDNQTPNSLQIKDKNLDTKPTDNNSTSANNSLQSSLITSLPIIAVKTIGWATYYILTSSIGRKALATGVVYFYGAPIIPLVTPMGLLTSAAWLLL